MATSTSDVSPIQIMTVDGRISATYDASVEMLDAYLTMQLGACEDEIARFETKYGEYFADFARAWERDEIPNGRSHEVERDYMEWEGLIVERQTLYTLIEAVDDLGCGIAALMTELAIAKGRDEFERLTSQEIASWADSSDP